MTQTSASTRIARRADSVRGAHRRLWDSTRPMWSQRLGRGVRILAISLVVYVLMGPLVAILLGAFRTSPLSPTATWTLDGFHQVFSDLGVAGALMTSIGYSGAVTILALAFATFFAVINTRTSVPLRGLITPLMVALAVVPNLFYALAWSMLGSPDGSLVSAVLRPLGSDEWWTGSLTVGWAGLVAVTAIKVTGLAYLLLIGPIRNLDPGAEDAAVMCGVPRFRAFREVSLPSLLPALTGTGVLLLIAGLETFEMPAILGRPVGIEPLSVFLYSYLDSDLQPDYASAGALSLVFVAIVAILVTIQRKVLGKRDFSSVGGKARQYAKLRLSPLATVAATICIALIALVAIVLPLTQIVVGSFQTYFGAFGFWTLENYTSALSNRRMAQTLAATLLITVIGGAISAALCFALSYFIHRKRESRAAGLLKAATWVPAAAPGIVLSLALLWMYLYTPGLRQLYGTPWMMMLALIVATLPVAARAIEGSVVQIRVELEEASRLSGASQFRGIWDVTVRLCVPSILAGWLLVGLMMSGRLDIPLLLQSTGNQTVTTVAYAMYARGQIAEAAGVYCLYLAMLAVIMFLVAVLFRAFKRQTARQLANTES